MAGVVVPAVTDDQMNSLAPVHPMESTYPTITVVDQLVAIQGRLYLAALLGIDGKNLLLAFLDTR